MHVVHFTDNSAHHALYDRSTMTPSRAESNYVKLAVSALPDLIRLEK